MKLIRSAGMLGFGLLSAACSKHDTSPGMVDELPEAEVQVASVEARTQIRTHGLPGTVHPADKAVIATKLMAVVAEADVVIGQEVKEGDILIVLSAEEISAQVEQAEASLAQLVRNLEREQALLAQSATTAESVRTLEDQIKVARARLAEARIMESYTRIRAPFDGTITAKNIRRGDLATPGTPLLEIEGEGSLQVYVQVPDSLAELKYGDAVEIEAGKHRLTGRLSEWSPAADPASRTRLAKLDLAKEAEVRSGQFVRVLWPAEKVTSLWIPFNVLSKFGQMERVFVMENNVLHLRLVKTGASTENSVQVLAGLREGEKVVLFPHSSFRDGQPATLKP